MTEETTIMCYYYADRPDVVYMEEPKPFTWYTSAGFHSIFWPALVGIILIFVLIIRKLAYIAKHRGENGEKCNAVMPPPAYSPNLYIVADSSIMGADGEKKLPAFDGPVVEASGPPLPAMTMTMTDKASGPQMTSLVMTDKAVEALSPIV